MAVNSIYQKNSRYSGIGFIPIGAHQQDATVSSSTTIEPSGLDDGLESQVNAVMIQTTSRDVRYTLDGTTPTSTKGFLMYSGQVPIIIPLCGNTSLKLIEVGATATVEYQFGKVVDE